MPLKPTVDKKAIPDSEIDKLRLQISIIGVSYNREHTADGEAGVTVLIEATFVLPKNKVLGYAKLPFRPIESADLQVEVEALTPKGMETVCLGVHNTEITTMATPEVEVGASFGSAKFSGVGTVEKTTKEKHDHIYLLGHRGMGTKAHWEFRNDEKHVYPRQIYLLAQFSSNTSQDVFPFTIRFRSDCQVTFGDRVLDACRHAIGLPSQRIEFEIPGRYKEDTVKQYIDGGMVGLRAAMKGSFEVPERCVLTSKRT